MASFFKSLFKKKTSDTNAEQNASPVQFKVGQIWKYDNRPGENDSIIFILKIEQYEKAGIIVHIQVQGIRMYNPHVASGYSDLIGHLPYSYDSLSKSVTSLVTENNELPDFMDGYDQWKEAWDSGSAGFWTIDVKEAVEGIDGMMRQNNNNG